MGMDHRCLVLSGRLLGEQDVATVHARLAAAFGMEMGGFRERVFERAPLIIRRGLDETTAEAQATQLREMGVEADVLPDSDRLAWLRRDGQVRGPLPEDALARYAQPGDQWCHDGGQTWFDWSAQTGHDVPPLPEVDPSLHAFAEAEPPPLPASPTLPLPPPVPGEEAPVRVAKSPLSTAAVVSLLLGLLALFYRPLSLVALLLAITTLVYLYRRPLLRGRALGVVALVLGGAAFALWMHRPADATAQPYVARPLKPLATGEAKDVKSEPTGCASKTAAPKNDEDRFLVTGQRLLTGRAQRKGDTYVAEAAVSVNAECQPSALQLYVFHHGVFIGPALSTAASLATTRLSDFDLVDDQHLRVTLAQCSDKPDDCAATTIKQIAVMPGGGGWTLGEIK